MHATKRVGRKTGRVRLLNWNLEFAPPGSARAVAIAGVVDGHAPDVVCLTETHVTWPLADGHWVWAEADYGYEQRGDRRKVGLWSRSPWSEVDTVGDPSLPGGRFVAGVTSTDVGPVRFVGVCIPWRAAHVTTGRRDRAPWEDHVAYLRSLATLIPRWLDGPPLVVVGDFNQRVPRSYTPIAVHEELDQAMTPLSIVTAGTIPGLEGPVIDHVALGPGLVVRTVEGISRMVEDRRVSDHDGVVVDLVTG